MDRISGMDTENEHSISLQRMVPEGKIRSAKYEFLGKRYDGEHQKYRQFFNINHT